jgi:hypothetical protein
MVFYVAKGLQLAGLIGVAGALYIGLMQGDAMVKELRLAALGAAFFYAGRLIETRQRG